MFSFVEIQDQKKSYLRTAGLQQGARLVNLGYVANEKWEGIDIEMVTSEGKVFTERTFGPTLDKVFPKKLWQDGKEIGEETKEQALERVQGELAQKLFYLALCYTDADTIRNKVKECSGVKDMVDKINAVIKSNKDWATIELNILTIWKNSPSKQRSNLIIADKIKWVECAVVNPEGGYMPTKINLTAWQRTNGMKEEFPYNGNQSPAVSEVTAASLPF